MELAGEGSGDCARGGALLRSYYEKGVTAEYKGDVDMVTEADRASEALISERLKTAFQGTGSMARRERARAGCGVPLVCGPAGWDDELRAWISGILRGDGM